MVVFFLWWLPYQTKKKHTKNHEIFSLETKKLPGIQCPVFLQKLVKRIQIRRDAHCDDLWSQSRMT